MRIYLAARFSKRHILQNWAVDLEKRGHKIVSRWSKRGSDHIKPTGLSGRAADAERERFAREDIEDIRECDCVLSLMEEPRSNGRGGRHVEFGYGLALGKLMVIVGDQETVFHHLPEVAHFWSIDDAIEYIDKHSSAVRVLAECHQNDTSFDPAFDPAEKSKGPLTADPCQNGAPGRSRTSDLLVRSQNDK